MIPRQLITLLGILACGLVIALGAVFVAAPTFLQAADTGAQTAQVSQTNQLYRTQIEGLRVQSERMPEIEAAVAGLRAEVPAADRFDEVFELIARAADASGVTVETITAGDPTPFAVRTEALAVGEQPEAAASDPAAGATPDPAAGATPDPGATAPPGASEPTAVEGPQQVEFTFDLKATDMGQVITFLDTLRTGPRLLLPVVTQVSRSGEGLSLTVSALAFVLPEE